MKNVFKSFAALAAILSFAACQKEVSPVEPAQNLYYVSFVAEEPATKTTVAQDTDEEGNKVAIYSWTASDASADRWTVYRGLEAATEVTPSLFKGVMTITAGFETPSETGDKFVALFNKGINAVQNITNESVYDPTSDVMISAEVPYEVGKESYGFRFKRESAFALMTAKGLEGTTVTGVSINADKVLSADYNYENKAFEETGEKTIVINTNSLVNDGAAPVYFATVPVDEANLNVAVVTVDENGDFKAAYEKSFTKAISFARGDVHSFGTTLTDNKVTSLTLDLSIDETTTATENELSWDRTFVKVVAAKANSTTNANNYYPGTSGKTYTSTRFYKGSLLTITPLIGVEIKSIKFTATSNDYASELAESSWGENAYVGVSGTMVTITPSNKNALVAEIGGNCGFTKIEVELGKPSIVHATGVTLNQTTLSLNTEETETLIATVAPEDAINKSVTWESSDDNVATVSNGVVRGISAGNATITVTTVDGEYTATCEVTVTSGSAATYKWVKISSLADLEDGGKYYLATNNGVNLFNGDIQSGHLQVGTTSAVYANGKLATIPDDAKEIELIATATAEQYYIMYNGGYLHATAAKSGNFSYVEASKFSSSDTNAWTFSVDEGTFDAVGSVKAAYIRSYNENSFRSYANTNNGARFVLYKRYIDMPTCAAPTLTNGSEGEVSVGTVVYLTNNEEGSTIRYTVNGNDPTSTSTEYTSAGISITDDCTIKAAAFKDNYNTSAVLTLNYTVPIVANPSISFDGTTVNITCSTSGATIHYEIGGDDVSEPTSDSDVYDPSNKPSVSDGQTVKAFAIKSGSKDSQVVSLKYTTTPVVLTTVTVSGEPTKKTYTAGDSFESAGLTVTGTYSDSHQETITEGITWSEPAALTVGQTSVTITATVSGITSEEYTVTGLTVTAAGPTDFSSTYTSNVTLSGSNKVKISNVEYPCATVGSSKNAGSTTFTVNSGTKYLTLHVVGWNGENGKTHTISTNVGTITPAKLTTTSDTGAANTSPFTLSKNDYSSTEYYFVFELSGVTSEATITISNSGGKQRGVYFGVNAE